MTDGLRVLCEIAPPPETFRDHACPSAGWTVSTARTVCLSGASCNFGIPHCRDKPRKLDLEVLSQAFMVSSGVDGHDSGH